MNETSGVWRNQIILALALMLIGFGFVIQMRSYERLSERLESESEADLVEIIDELNGEIEDIRGELLNERMKLTEFRDANVDGQAMLTRTSEEIVELAKFVGEAEATGPGAVIEIKNKENLLVGLDIRQVVEELRASGAWAISINGHRLAHSTGIWRSDGKLFLDGRELELDLRIEALGPPTLLAQAITLPRGIRDKLETLRGVEVAVREETSVRLGPVEKQGDARLTKPVDDTIKQ